MPVYIYAILLSVIMSLCVLWLYVYLCVFLLRFHICYFIQCYLRVYGSSSGPAPVGRAQNT